MNEVWACRCTYRDCIVIWSGAGEYTVHGFSSGVGIWSKGGFNKLDNPRDVFCSDVCPYRADKAKMGPENEVE